MLSLFLYIRMQPLNKPDTQNNCIGLASAKRTRFDSLEVTQRHKLLARSRTTRFHVRYQSIGRIQAAHTARRLVTQVRGTYKSWWKGFFLQ